MSKPKDNFTTPIQMKRLELKRNSSVLKESAEKTTGSSTSAATTILACNTKSTHRRLPQSDKRINYRNSDEKDEPPVLHSPGTPTSTLTQQRQAVSTNCRPYRLSLSKKVREKMTKKRLEFHLANEIEKEEEVTESNSEKANKTSEAKINEECGTTQNFREDCNKIEKPEENIDFCSKLPANMSAQELMVQIETMRSDLNIRQEHAKKVQELKEAIAVWKNGFSAALSDLQQKIDTRLDTETLLDQLKIPQEMLKYVND